MREYELRALVSQTARRMIARSDGNLHDIAHFLKVYAYARTIGVGEGLEAEAQAVLEIAALLHDIACPLCREKYGSTGGKYQEREGGPLAEEFLRESGLPPAMAARAAYLVAHHHTPERADGPDYRILLEADYLVNAEEGGYSRESIRRARETLFRTGTGTALLESIYLRESD